MGFAYIEKESKDRMRRAEISTHEHCYSIHLYTYANLGIVSCGGRMEGWCHRRIMERHYELPTAFYSDGQIKKKMYDFLREGVLPNEAEILDCWKKFGSENMGSK